MKNAKKQSAGRVIKKVTLMGLCANLVLAAVKGVAGVLGGSISLVADALHSASDSLTDIAVIIGYYFGSRDADENHPYGHGRLETLAAVFIGLVLVVVGGGMVYYAAGKIASKQVKLPTDSVAAIAFFSVIVKELVYRFARNAAVRIKSSMVYANAWHHRSDVLSSIAVIAGWAAGRLGFAYADPIAAIVVGVMIIFVAVEILTKSFAELTEASVDRQTRKQIEDVLNSYPAVNKWHKLRTRLVGREIFFDLHILVDPDLNIKQAHEVSERLENTLHEQIPQPINITIHIEPDIPELRI